MNLPVSFRFATDTATLAIFDPARLHHRLADTGDWWSIPSDETAEVNLGNMLAVSTGTDGAYDVDVSAVSDTPPGPFIEALVACESGRVFVGAGEFIPGDGLTTTDKYGGRFIDLPSGTYRVRVWRPSAWSLKVSLIPCDGPAQNHFDNTLRIESA